MVISRQEPDCSEENAESSKGKKDIPKRVRVT